MPAVSQTPSAEATAQAQAQPRQTARSVEPLRSFGKLQEAKQIDISQRIQRKSIVPYCIHSSTSLIIHNYS